MLRLQHKEAVSKGSCKPTRGGGIREGNSNVPLCLLVSVPRLKCHQQMQLFLSSLCSACVTVLENAGGLGSGLNL